LSVEWCKGIVEGAIIIELKKHIDERGFLCETFRSDELPQGLNPVMSYISYTEPGVARGPHEHTAQTDIFSFIGPGNFLLKIWDNRSNSATYGHFMRIFCGKDNPVTVIIPPGIIHGYKNISKNERGMVINYPNRLFMGKGRKEPIDEIRHEDDPSNHCQMD
jgi:dTDP-4-dehydrorhamnose 3,5-epimerase